MTYRFVLTCAVALLSLGLTLGGSSFSDSQDQCLLDAFGDASWLACISPIAAQVQDDFNIAAMCLSGENEALHCLLSKIDECYDFLAGMLSSTGMTQEQAAVVDLSTIWNDEIVNILCEIYGGQCDVVPACLSAVGNYWEEPFPLIEEVQAVVGLCGPKCFYVNNDTCPGVIKFFRAIAFVMFTKDFDNARIERTRTFKDENCMKAENFDIDCVLEKLKSSEMQTCHAEAFSGLIVNNDPCQMKACIDAMVMPVCGATSSDILKEGVMVTMPEPSSRPCLPGASASCLKASVSFVLLTILTLILT